MIRFPENETNQALAKRIFLTNLDDSDRFPKYFTLETCNSCNARCTMCPKSLELNRPVELMSDELFLRIVEQLAPQKDWIETVGLNSDGEPTLDRKLPERIRLLKEAGIKRVNFTTNGALMRGAYAEGILDAGVDEVYFSIDSNQDEVFNKIRVGLKLSQVRENVHAFLTQRDKTQSKTRVRIRMVEMDENRDEIQAWADYWRPFLREGDRLQSMPAHTWSGLIAQEREENVRVLSDKPCVSPFSSMAINYDGLVQLCDSDVRQKVMLGDVNTQKIQDIWQSDAFRRIRELHATAQRNQIDICQGCDHWSRGFVDR